MFAGQKLVLVDDRAHVLASEGGHDVLRMTQCVDNLKLFQVLGVLKESQNRPFHDEVVEIHGHQIGHRNAVNELQFLDVLGLLGVIAVQAALVLEIDERLGSDVLGQQKCPAVVFFFLIMGDPFLDT